MSGLTLDTGALIAMERGERRMRGVWAQAIAHGLRITVPAPVVAEWWRGQRGPIGKLLDVDGVVVEAMDGTLARTIGIALAAVRKPGPSVVDATVVASAALRGDVVYTSDLDDLGVIRDAAFPGVRLMGVTART